MEEKWIVVYSETLKHEALEKITAEIEKDNEFVINKDNVREYFECNSFLDVLEANNIEYNIELNRVHEWRDREGDRLGDVYLSVYIKESDQEKLTYSEPDYFNLPEELRGINLNEPEEDSKDGVGEKIAKIFMNIILIMIIALFWGLAISQEEKNVRRFCFFIGLIFVLFLIKENKNKKGGHNEFKN